MASTGVEPARPRGHRILSTARLPFPPRGQVDERGCEAGMSWRVCCSTTEPAAAPEGFAPSRPCGHQVGSDNPASSVHRSGWLESNQHYSCVRGRRLSIKPSSRWDVYSVGATGFEPATPASKAGVLPDCTTSRFPWQGSNLHHPGQSRAASQLADRGADDGDGGNRTFFCAFSVRRLDHVGNVSIGWAW